MVPINVQGLSPIATPWFADYKMPWFAEVHAHLPNAPPCAQVQRLRDRAQTLQSDPYKRHFFS
jgi:hypothetical protein